MSNPNETRLRPRHGAMHHIPKEDLSLDQNVSQLLPLSKLFSIWGTPLLAFDLNESDTLAAKKGTVEPEEQTC